MTDAEKLMLTMLRRLDAKVERLALDIHEIKVRLTSAQENSAIAQKRIDRLECRIDSLEAKE